MSFKKAYLVENMTEVLIATPGGEFDIKEVGTQLADIVTVEKLPNNQDNTSLLQKAIDSKKIVRLQKDVVYRIDNTITLLSDTHIDGCGAKLEFYGSYACLFGSDIENIKIENLEIECKGITGLETHGILITNTNKIRLKNVISKKANGNGFFITHSENIYIQDCECIENAKGEFGGAGVLIGYNEISGSSKLLIENSNFSNNGTDPTHHGVYISSKTDLPITKDFMIVNNIFENNAGGGLNTNNTIDGLIITGNIFRGNKTFGIALINASNCLVCNNEIYDTGRLVDLTDNIAGIYISGTHNRLKIHDNLINTVLGGMGIQLGSSTGVNSLSVECYNNTILLADTTGISYAGKGYNKIKINNNVIYSCGSHGIDVNGTSEVDVLKGVSITGNICFNNGRLSTFKAGIKAWNICESIISLNNCYDDQTIKTQTYGLTGNNGNKNNSFKSNRAYGNLTTDYDFKEQTYRLDLNGFPLNFNAQPTAGTWKKGDIFYNNSPTPGGYIGWVCVTAGTPGSWKGFGLIEA